MPMGITRVADYYGFLPEAERHREALAAALDGAADLARPGVGITAGMNRLEAAKGDFGGKKAPPFGSKEKDDDSDEDDDDKPWHEGRVAGYGDGSGIDYAHYQDRFDPDSGHSYESGYDPEGDWESHRSTPIGPQAVTASFWGE